MKTVALILLIPALCFNPASARKHSQSLALHPGWNLVSWNIEPLNPIFTMADILDSASNTWFSSDTSNKVYRYDLDRSHYYPDPNHPSYGQWPWNLPWAYYLHMNNTHFWQFGNKPLLDSTAFTFFPSNAWTGDSAVGGDQVRWFFMGYSTHGLMKLGSIPDESTQRNGNPANFTYTGPFHWLIWKDTTSYPLDDLKIVKTDDGRSYIPFVPPPSSQSQYTTLDQIGVLEPGKGYFLGFVCDTTLHPYFKGWPDYPIWYVNNVPHAKGGESQIASVGHFQFKPFTQWFYPIVIDSVDTSQTPLSPGDEIAVFDGNLCVGSVEFTGTYPLVLNAWEDDIATPDVIDGYTYGHTMTFKWYDASENTEAEFNLPPITLSLQPDSLVAPTHSGFGYGAYASRNFASGVNSIVHLPREYKLGQNYPNPFNPETIIPLELPQRSDIKVELYNIMGQQVGLIYQGVQNAGWPKIHFNASRLASGIYFYRITAKGLERGGQFEKTSKMLLLK